MVIRILVGREFKKKQHHSADYKRKHQLQTCLNKAKYTLCIRLIVDYLRFQSSAQNIRMKYFFRVFARFPYVSFAFFIKQL